MDKIESILLKLKSNNKYQQRFYDIIEDLEEYPYFDNQYSELYNFSYYGVECNMKRNRHGNWCGYITFSESVIDFDSNIYCDDLLRVHGGITFYGKNLDGGRTIGFDTSHLRDIDLMDIFMRSPNKISQKSLYRDYNYTRNEVRRLAQQITGIVSC